MQIRIYSINPLPDELRGTFELPAWPYYNGNATDIPKELVEYFQKYSIIRYQDDYVKYPVGIVVPYQGKDYSNERSAFPAYLSAAWLDNENLSIIKWPYDDPRGHSLRAKIQDTIGDDFAWSIWNREVMVTRMTLSMVKLLSGYKPQRGKNAKFDETSGGIYFETETEV